MPYIVIVLDIMLIFPLHFTPVCLVQDFTNVASSSNGMSVLFFQVELVFRNVTTIRKASVKAFSHENSQLVFFVCVCLCVCGLSLICFVGFHFAEVYAWNLASISNSLLGLFPRKLRKVLETTLISWGVKTKKS